MNPKSFSAGRHHCAKTASPDFALPGLRPIHLVAVARLSAIPSARKAPR